MAYACDVCEKIAQTEMNSIALEVVDKTAGCDTNIRMVIFRNLCNDCLTAFREGGVALLVEVMRSASRERVKKLSGEAL